MYEYSNLDYILQKSIHGIAHTWNWATGRTTAHLADIIEAYGNSVSYKPSSFMWKNLAFYLRESPQDQRPGIASRLLKKLSPY